MNDAGRAYAKQRMLDAPDLQSLARVWGSLGREYQADPEIQKLKDTLKHARDNHDK